MLINQVEMETELGEKEKTPNSAKITANKQYFYKFNSGVNIHLKQSINNTFMKFYVKLILLYKYVQLIFGLFRDNLQKH